MQLPGVADATEQPCQNIPMVSAPAVSGQAMATTRTFLLGPAAPAQQQPHTVCILQRRLPEPKGRDWKGMREGGQRKGGGDFFFCTHPYKATEVITDVINQLSKRVPLTNAPFYKHSLAGPHLPLPLLSTLRPRGFALP